MTDMRPSPIVTHIAELRLRPVVSVPRETPLDEVARVMRMHDVSAAVVGEPGEPVAIVTERDLTRALADGWSPGEPVQAIASPDPLTISRRATVMEAATLMLREGLRHLIVTDGHRVAGVISMRDALSALVSEVTADTVFVRLSRLTIDPPELWLG